MSASSSTLPARGGGRAVSASQSREWRWSEMARLVTAEYPYCTMQGVRVADGMIVACEGLQRSFSFKPVEAVEVVEPGLDAHWKALDALCVRMGSGRLAELRFSGGRPVSARTSEGGRRFRRAEDKPVAKEHDLLS
jgi:hypothetical protein